MVLLPENWIKTEAKKQWHKDISLPTLDKALVDEINANGLAPKPLKPKAGVYKLLLAMKADFTH